jgi:SAM-dependent methyltransferase
MSSCLVAGPSRRRSSDWSVHSVHIDGEELTMAKPAELWAAGGAYEPYVGRWSRLVAREFLAWLAVGEGAGWLDVGCGTGALTQTMLTVANPAAVLGIDPSPGYVAYARTQSTDRRAQFAVADAGRLPIADARMDAVVSGLVLNFVPDPDQAVREMVRVTRAGGRVAAYVWDYAGKMELIRCFWDAAAVVGPAAVELDEGRRFGLCRPEPLACVFQDAGLVEVRTRPIDLATRFRDFADYWTPFLGGQGPAPGYAMSLQAEQRTALREELRARLPVAPDGSISLVARAWAVQGACGRYPV